MDTVFTVFLYVLFFSACLRHIVRTFTFILDFNEKRKNRRLDAPKH